MPLYFPDFLALSGFFSPKGGICAIEADCVLPAMSDVESGCLLQYSSCQEMILVLTVFER